MSEWRYTNLVELATHVGGLMLRDKNPNPHKLIVFENEFIKVYWDGYVAVKEGYAWEGNSIINHIPGFEGSVMKNPPLGMKIKCKDGKGVRTTTRASMFHDALYQFAKPISIALGIRESEVLVAADMVYYLIAREDGFSFASIYSGFIDTLGWTYHQIMKIF